MAQQPTADQIKKLPAWAQAYIKNLEQERIGAIRALNKFTLSQEPSHIYVRDNPCTGEGGKPGPVSKHCFIQASRVCFSMNFEQDDLELEVSVHPDENRIEVRMPRAFPFIHPQGNNLFYICENPNWRNE